MATSELAYLKEIADQLKKMAADGKEAKELSTVANNISIMTTKQGAADKSSESLLGRLIDVLKKAFIVEVTENNTTVEKGVAELLKEQLVKLTSINTALGLINTSIGTVATKVETGDANIVAALTGQNGIASLLTAGNTSLSNIDNNTQNITVSVTASLDDSRIVSAIEDVDDRLVSAIGGDNVADILKSTELGVASIDGKIPSSS